MNIAQKTRGIVFKNYSYISYLFIAYKLQGGI